MLPWFEGRREGWDHYNFIKKKQFSHANLSVWFGLNIQNNKKISDILTHF